MNINLSTEQIIKLRTFLDADPDSEQISANEYVCDLYMLENPVSLDLVFKGDTVFADGAAFLLYDSEMDGWYIDEQINCPEAVKAMLIEAGII